MAVFEPWQPSRRVEPEIQLEYRNPVLKRCDYRDVEICEKTLSNTGPAAENAEKAGESV